MSAFPAAAVAATRILVVGDVMLDRYWFGKVERISPEAPVPVVHVVKREDRLGGASNVARNIASLGAQATLLGIVGKDEAGEQLSKLLEADGVQGQLVLDPSIHTTMKMRVLGQQQQMLRVDFEEKPSATALDALRARFEPLLASHDVVVLSDYAKGVLTEVDALIEIARAKGLPILVDPKGSDYNRYRGATLVTPNRSEMQQAVGLWSSEADLTDRAQKLRAHLQLEAITSMPRLMRYLMCQVLAILSWQP